MTCVELQESLIENDSGGTAAQRAHLRDCPHCAGLVADLLVIACAAGELRAAHEPGPHVWNSIETSLRREGIIKPFARRSLLPSLTGSWSWTGWALPAAAVVLITIGILVRPHAPPPGVVTGGVTSPPASDAERPDRRVIEQVEIEVQVVRIKERLRRERLFQDGVRNTQEYDR